MSCCHVSYQVMTDLKRMSQPIKICCNSVTQYVTAHPYSQLGGDVTGPPPGVLRVKVGRGAAQEARFKDVSTATVGKEAALVQVHLLPRCLEVQSHCTGRKSGVINTASPVAHVPAENISASVNAELQSVNR